MGNVSLYFVVHQIATFTDHRLACCELNFCPLIAKRKSNRPPALDKSVIRDANVQDAYQERVTSLLGQHDPETLSSDTISTDIRSALVCAAEMALPVKQKPSSQKSLLA